jgi:ApbE superfamily uncharacterized protein (UPF0280 family)
MYQKRTYRNRVHPEKLVSFQVMVKETDLMVHAGERLEQQTRELVLLQRSYLEAFIATHPDFAATLVPWKLNGPAPKIVTEMTAAGQSAGVGPMAAVAGAIAEQVGRGLLEFTDQVIIENGGDVFICTMTPVTVAVFAGKSSLSMRVGLRLGGGLEPAAVCTSSGTVGHSLSLGRADAVCVVSESCCLADAAATSIANRVHCTADIEDAIAVAKHIDALRGVVIIVGDKMGVWGELKVVSMPPKKG